MGVIGEAYINIIAVGDDFEDSVKRASEPGLKGLEEDAEGAGLGAGAGLGSGIEKGTKDGLDDAEKDMDSRGESMGKKLTGGLKSVLENLGGMFGLPVDSLTKSIDKAGGAMDSTASKSTGLGSKLASLGGGIALGAAAGFVAFSALSIHSAMDFQSSVTSIAANAGIPVSAAKKIGDAFLSTAGTTIYSGQQMATAYAGVAGQLGAMEGHALNSKQAMQVMSASMDLAEASGTDLGSATKSLASVMQAYGINSKGASEASNQLFESSRMSGNNVETVTAAMARLHTQLGITTPPIGQTGALLVDMAEHGASGSVAIRTLSSAMTTLLKPTTDVASSQQALKQALGDLPPQLDSLAKQYESGTMTSKQLSAATKDMTTAQAASWKTFVSASDAADKAKDSVKNMGITVTNSQGSFVGMKSVIDQLGTSLKGQSQAQQLATLTTDFGAKAAKELLSTIDAGPAAYDKATAAVDRAGSAHKAAAVQGQTLDHQIEVLKASVEDIATKWGGVLIPILEKVGGVFVKVSTFIVDHKVVLIGLAVVVGGIVMAAITAWVAGLAASALAALAAVAPTTAFGAAAAAAAIAIDGAILPIILIVAAIAALGVAIYELVTHWSAVWDEVKRIVGDAWHGIESAFGDVEKFFEGIPGKILSALSDFGKLLLKWITDAWNTMVSWVMSAVNLYIQWWLLLPVKIIAAIIQFAPMLLSWITSAWNAMVNWVVTAFQNEVAFWEALPGRILSALASLGQLLLGWITKAWGMVTSGLSTAWGKTSSFVSGIPGSILGLLGDAGTQLLQWGKDLIQGLVNGIKSMASAVGGAIKGLFDDLPGVSLLRKIPGLSWLATGGLVTKPTLAVVGEAGPEMVLPLGKIQQYLGAVAPLPTGTPSTSTFGTAPTVGTGGGVTVVVQVNPGAVVINGLNPNDSNTAQTMINDGFVALARELQSGTAPTRVGAG